MAKGRATSVKPDEPARRRTDGWRTEGGRTRVSEGKTARTLPRSTSTPHSIRPSGARPDRVARPAGASRVPELLPIRYGRMASSPFAFFRGAALVMAADLATPCSGLVVTRSAAMRT